MKRAFLKSASRAGMDLVLRVGMVRAVRRVVRARGLVPEAARAVRPAPKAKAETIVASNATIADRAVMVEAVVLNRAAAVDPVADLVRRERRSIIRLRHC